MGLDNENGSAALKTVNRLATNQPSIASFKSKQTADGFYRVDKYWPKPIVLISLGIAHSGVD